MTMHVFICVSRFDFLVARLRGVFERVRVQVPSLAPQKNKTNHEQDLWFVFFDKDWFGIKFKIINSSKY